ncbi:hypothetical protein GCM10020331_005280 [Ectobacillus funiculus]
MNVIDLNAERQRRQKKKKTNDYYSNYKKRVYEEDGEIKFEISGEREVPLAWLDK